MTACSAEDVTSVEIALPSKAQYCLDGGVMQRQSRNG